MNKSIWYNEIKDQFIYSISIGNNFILSKDGVNFRGKFYKLEDISKRGYCFIGNL